LRKLEIKDGTLSAGDLVLGRGMDNKSIEKFRHDEWMSSFQANKETARHAPNVGMLYNMFHTKPGALCLCVGAGPSLHKNLKTLKIIYDSQRPFILACDAAYNTLCEAGIRPDLTMTVDGSPTVVDFFKDEYIRKDDYFTSMLHTHPDVTAKIGKGRVFWGNVATNEGMPLEFRKELGERFQDVVASYVVGTALMHLAARMGFHIVGSLGNDFNLKGDVSEQYPNCNKFVVSLTTADGKETDGRLYCMIEPFFLAAKSAEEIPKIYYRCNFIDFSSSPMQTWIKMKLREVMGKQFVSLDWKQYLMSRYNYVY